MNLASNSKTHEISSRDVSIKPLETNSRNKRKSKTPKKWNNKDSNLCLKMNKLSLFRYISPENQSLISSQEKQSEFYREYLRKAGCSVEPIKLRFTRKRQVQTDGLGTTSFYEVTNTSNKKHSQKNVDFSRNTLEIADGRKNSETNNSKENNLFGVFRNPNVKSSGIHGCRRVNGSNDANQFNHQRTTEYRKIKTSKKTTSKIAKNSKVGRNQSKRFLPKVHESPTRKQPPRACKVISPESKHPIHKFIHQGNISNSVCGIKGGDSIAKRSAMNSAIPNFQHSTDSVSRVKTRALQNNKQDHSGKRKNNVDFTCKKRCKTFHENKSIPRHKSECNWFFLYHADSKNKDNTVNKCPIRNEIDEWPSSINRTDILRKSKITPLVSGSLNNYVSSSINHRFINNCNGNPQKGLLQNKELATPSHNNKNNASIETFNVKNNQWTQYRSPNNSKIKLFSSSDNQLNISRKIQRPCQNQIKFDQHRFKSSELDIGPLAFKNMKCQNAVGKEINKETDSCTKVRNALLNTTTQKHIRPIFENDERFSLNGDNSKTMLSNRMFNNPTFNNNVFNNNIFNNNMFNKRIIQNETAENSLLSVNIKYDIRGRFNERCINKPSFQMRLPKHAINSSHRLQPFIKEINDVLNISSTTFIQKFENSRSHSLSNIFLSETRIFNQRTLQNTVSPNYFSIASSSHNIISKSPKRRLHELNSFQATIRKSKKLPSYKLLCADVSDDLEDREIYADVATNKTKNIEGISSKMAKSSTYGVLSQKDSDNTENKLKHTEVATNVGKSTKSLDWKAVQSSLPEIFLKSIAKYINDEGIPNDAATIRGQNAKNLFTTESKSSIREIFPKNMTNSVEIGKSSSKVDANEPKKHENIVERMITFSTHKFFSKKNNNAEQNSIQITSVNRKMPDKNLHKNNFRNIAKNIVSIDKAIMLEQYSKCNHDSTTKSILRRILTKTVGNKVVGKNISNVTTKIQTRKNNIDKKIAIFHTKISSKCETHIVKENNNSTKILTVISKSDKFTKQCNAATSMNENLYENTAINSECESKTNNVSTNRRPDVHSEKTSPHVVCLQSVKSNIKDARNGSKIENNERKNPVFPDLNTTLSSLNENFPKCMTNNVEEIKNCNETTISRLEQNSSDGNTTNSSLCELLLKKSDDTRNFTVVGIVRGENVSSNKTVSLQENFFEFKVNVVKNGGKTTKVITMRRQNVKNVRIIKSSSCKILPNRENTSEGKRNAKNASTIQTKTVKKHDATSSFHDSDSKNMTKSPMTNKNAENKKKSNDLTIIRTQNSLEKRKNITDTIKRQNIHNTSGVKSYSHAILSKTKACNAVDEQNSNQEANVTKEIAMKFDLSKTDSLPINMTNVINYDKTKISETTAIKRQNNNVKTTIHSSCESSSKNECVSMEEKQNPYAVTTDRKNCLKSFCSEQTLPVNLSKDNDNVNGDGNSCLISILRKENSNDVSSIKSSSPKSKYQNLVDKEKSKQNSDEIVIAQRNNVENNNLCDTFSLRGNLSENTCNVKEGGKSNTIIKTTNTFNVITKLPSSVELAIDNSASNIDNNPNCNENCSNRIKCKLNVNLKNAACSQENLSKNMTSEKGEKASVVACNSKHVKTIDALSHETSPKNFAGISYNGQNSNKVYSNAEKNIKVVDQDTRNSSSQECAHVNVESNPTSNETDSTGKNIEIIDLTDDGVFPEFNNETTSISQRISKRKFDFGEVYIERIQFREYTCSKCNGIFTNHDALHRHKNQCGLISSNQDASSVSQEEPHKCDDYIEKAVYPCTICRKFFSTYKFKKIHELQCRIQVPNTNDLKNAVN